HQVGTPLTPLPILQYALFSLLSTPPNFLWQEALESSFPAYRLAPSPADLAADKDSKDGETETGNVGPRLSVRNTITKTLLDQSLGAAVNTLMFSLFMNGIRQGMAHHPPGAGVGALLAGGDVVRAGAVEWDAVWGAAKGEFWGLVMAGWRFWPIVSLVNYVFLTSVEARSLVGALAGLGWGVYLSLMTGGK
ncbi:hypothetical protein C8A05DRAFT_18730, partial [Staphylotrichum tortipilum]